MKTESQLTLSQLSVSGLFEPQESRSLQQYKGKGTFFTSVFTLTNSAMGAGLLAFPYAFSQCGLAMGVGLTIAFGSIMGYTAHVLAAATAHAQELAPGSNARSYQDVARVLVGPRLEAAVIFTMSIFLFGSCIGYLVVIGDMMDPLVAPLLKDTAVEFDSRRCIIAAVGSVVVLPLCLLPRVSMFGFTSLLSVISVVYIASVVCIDALVERGGIGHKTESVEMMRGIGGMFLAIPLLCLALHCHSFVPMIYSEIEVSQRNLPFMNRVIAYSLTVCTVVFLPVGIFGYYRFGNMTPQDVLTGYKSGNTAITLATMGIACTVTFCFPICHFAVCTAMFSHGRRTGLLREALPINDKGAQLMIPQRFQRREAVLFVGSAMAVAMYASQLASIFGLFSATCGSLVIFIYPAIFLSKLPCRGSQLWHSVLVGFLLLVGASIMLVGTAITLQNMF